MDVPGTLSEYKSWFPMFVSVMLFTGQFLMQLYLKSVLYVIMQRVTLYRHAVIKLTTLSKIYKAWSSRGSELHERVSFEEKERLCDDIDLISRALYTAYSNMKTFYQYHYQLQFLVFILFSPLYLLATAFTKFSIRYVLYFVYITGVRMPDLFLVTLITPKICNVQTLMRSAYYDTRVIQIQRTIKRWLYKFTQLEITYDCGYFRVDFSLFSVAFNFISLFIFALLE